MTELFKKQLLIILCSCGLVACVTSNEGVDEPEYRSETRGSDCISQMTIRDYQVLDDSNLIVTGSARRKYHVVLSRRAFGLASTWRIAFRSPSGRICSAFSEVVVNDGMGAEVINIHSVRQLTLEELDDLLVRFGKKEPDVNQTTAPEPVEGAEVEELD
jgi:hypothetical protein